MISFQQSCPTVNKRCRLKSLVWNVARTLTIDTTQLISKPVSSCDWSVWTSAVLLGTRIISGMRSAEERCSPRLKWAEFILCHSNHTWVWVNAVWVHPQLLSVEVKRYTARTNHPFTIHCRKEKYTWERTMKKNISNSMNTSRGGFWNALSFSYLCVITDSYPVKDTRILPLV